MKTKTENWRPSSNGLKTNTVNLRTSQEENEILKRAVEKLSEATGEKQNISKTIIEAVKQFEEPFFVNTVTYKLWCDIHASSLRWLQGIASDYRGLGFGAITASELGDILNRNLSGIKNRFNQRIDLNLQKLDISDNFILNNLRAGTADPLVSFEEKTVKNLEMIEYIQRSFTCFGSYNISVENYKIEAGNVSFTQADQERIKKSYCTTSINSNEQKQFLKLAEDTLSNLLELKAILQKNGVANVFGYGNLFEVTTSIPETIIFNKEILKRITKI